MIRRAAVLGLALVILFLTACAPDPVSQGMVTADGMTVTREGLVTFANKPG